MQFPNKNFHKLFHRFTNITHHFCSLFETKTSLNTNGGIFDEPLFFTASASKSHVFRAPTQYRRRADNGYQEEQAQQQPVQHYGRVFPLQFRQFPPVLFGQSLFVAVDASVHLVQDPYDLVLERIWNGKSNRR